MTHHCLLQYFIPSLGYQHYLEVMNKFQHLRDFVLSLEDDFTKFYAKGNKAAGTRIRKGMQDLKAMSQDIRMDVQNRKNS